MVESELARAYVVTCAGICNLAPDTDFIDCLTVCFHEVGSNSMDASLCLRLSKDNMSKVYCTLIVGTHTQI